MPDGDVSSYFQKREDLFISLLRTISAAAQYDFDDTHIREMSYTPVLYGNVEADQTLIRQGLAKLLKGDAAIPVQVVIPDEIAERQIAVAEAIVRQVGPDGVMKVKIVDGQK